MSHSKEEDCWLVIDGNVYDVTPFLDEHPGGFDIILASTGTSSFYNRKCLLLTGLMAHMSSATSAHLQFWGGTISVIRTRNNRKQMGGR